MLDEIREKIEGEIEELLHELHVILPERIEKAVELGDCEKILNISPPLNVNSLCRHD